MFLRLICLAVISLATCWEVVGSTQQEAAKLDGTWIATSWRRGDAEVGKDQVDTQLVITKDRYEFPHGINRVSEKGVLKIDEAKKTIDFTPDDGPAKGKTLVGIYKIEGKVLTLCFTGTGGARPTEFKSGDRNTVLAVYERKEEGSKKAKTAQRIQ